MRPAAPQVVFIETICNDEEMVRQNIDELRRSSPEYREVDDEEAELHFKERIQEYARIYQVRWDTYRPPPPPCHVASSTMLLGLAVGYKWPLEPFPPEEPKGVPIVILEACSYVQNFQ